MRTITTFCLMLTMLITTNLVAQQTVYVKAGGTGDGTTEELAYGNFGTALAQITTEGDILRIIGDMSLAGGQNLNSKTFAFTIEGDSDLSTLTGADGITRMFTINSGSGHNVTFKNLNITGATNSTGNGAVIGVFTNSAVTIDNCVFNNNSTIGNGGAIFASVGAISITNTLFETNSAAVKGGALYTTNANFTITGSTFYANATTDTSGQTGGSVLYVAGSGSTNSITNCTFFENTVGSLSNQDYGAIRTDNGNTTVTNSLFYDNKTNNGDGAPSDWGSGPNGTQTFNTSIAQWISTNVDNQDEGTGSITGLKGGGGTPADLASSNLTFNATSGYVEYNNVEEGTDSPIDFGSDGNDVGAWDYVDAPSDTTAPVITVLGDNPATVEQGAIYTDAGATADGGETVTTSGTVDTSTVGSYTLTYSATDAANNTGTATRTVNVVAPSNTIQNTVYVSSTGAGNIDGTSEANAYDSFGTAMEGIDSEGDKLIIIGTVPTIGQNLTSKSFAFTIEGLDASSTITGDGGTGRLFTINGATSADVTFKNLTLSGNNTTLAGGAVLFNNDAGAKVTFDNCNVTGNAVTHAAGGGALYFANGELNIINSSFENNTSIDEAGAINGVSGTITITNTLFKSNSAATKGGAIYSNNANFTITGSTFYANATTDTSGGGSVLYVAGSGSTNSITNCTFFENTVGSLNNQDYGAIRTDNGNTTVTNSLFYDNKTNNGDGAPSDWGSGPNGTQTFNTSIAQWISTNVDNQDEGAGSITGLKGGGGTPADLASSNLTFNATSGYVEYTLAAAGDDSPIDFGSDGNDVGAWNYVDTTAPVITVLGENPTTVEQGAIYTDAGATADGGETVTTSGTVDTSTVGAYTLTYSATDAANNTGTATRTVNVVNSGSSTLNTNYEVEDIIVYPNPTSTSLTITGSKNYNLKISNTLGQVLLQINDSNTIDVSSLSNGVYLINITDGVKSLTKRFNKQ